MPILRGRWHCAGNTLSDLPGTERALSKQEIGIMPGGQTLQADSEGTEGQLAVCLLLSGARVL